MGLEKYHEKRHFERTPEPEGKVGEFGAGRLYIIQKHAARSLHYDLRLEFDGVLKSWAVPRGPSMKPGEKRLAVHVEDHPIEYGAFEGVIPEGEYGAGTVMLWDRGTWEPIGDPRAGYARGDFKFTLHGEKLNGSWVLARMKGDPGEEGKNWLLIKKKDEAAITGSAPEPVDAMDRSVESGRSMREIAEEREKVWFEGSAVPGADVASQASPPRRKTTRKRKEKAALPAIDPSILPGARSAAQPELFRPALASPVAEIPAGENWIHEIKYDGYRILCMLSDGRARLISRNGLDWTPRFPDIARTASGLPVENVILDGEAVVVDSEGRTDFQALQNILEGIGAGRLVYYVFDIPHCLGYDLSYTPLIERKNLLRRLLSGPSSENGSPVLYADHIQGNGPAVFSNACRLGLEGIVSKQAGSPYLQKRSRNWVKVKCSHRQEFVIGGFTDPGGSRTGFGALLLGYHDRTGNLVYSGRVGTGFDERQLNEMTASLKPMEISRPPFVNPPTGYEAKGVHWVRPELVGEVGFGSWTDEGILRHPSFKGLREDKDPKKVVRETPARVEMGSADSGGSRKQSTERESETVSAACRKAAPSPRTGVVRSSTKSAGGPGPAVTLSSPDRILYPEMGVTKRALAEYYMDSADWIMPHLLGRPLTLVRCPEGWNRACFYQKHLGDAASPVLRAIPIQGKDGLEYYSVVDNREGLIALVQLGVLEIHVWGCRDGKLEQPDMMVFDLDPNPEVPRERMIQAAFRVRGRLSELGLRSFLKTTGGKGSTLWRLSHRVPAGILSRSFLTGSRAAWSGSRRANTSPRCPKTSAKERYSWIIFETGVGRPASAPIRQGRGGARRSRSPSGGRSLPRTWGPTASTLKTSAAGSPV